MYLLELRELTKRFSGIRAAEEVSLKVREGSIMSIIGPNGAGKTTIFNCITGITNPTKGRMIFLDADITDMPPDKISRMGIARTFQNIRLFKQMTVLENILVSEHRRTKTSLLDSILRTGRFSTEEQKAKQRAFEYLEFVGLEERVGDKAGSLPYGDQRRLEIARAMATEPRLLLLDEPTAGMNPQETNEIMELIKRIREMGMTVLLIEHDMKVVMGISEIIAVLDHGVKIAEGPPDDIRQDPVVIEAYLGKELS